MRQIMEENFWNLSKKPQIVCVENLSVTRTGPRSHTYRSKDSKKLRILSYLFQHAEGANKNTLNSLSGLNSQRWDIVNEMLIELNESGSIEIETHDEIKKGSVLYKITPKGKETIGKLKDLQISGLGGGFDFFESLEFD